LGAMVLDFWDRRSTKETRLAPLRIFSSDSLTRDLPDKEYAILGNLDRKLGAPKITRNLKSRRKTSFGVSRTDVFDVF